MLTVATLFIIFICIISIGAYFGGNPLPITEAYDGNRHPNQKNGSGSQNDSGGSAVAHAAAIYSATATRQGTGQVTRAAMAIPTAQQIAAMQQTSMLNQHMQMLQAYQNAARAYHGSHGLMPVQLTMHNCDKCGAAYESDHACPEPSSEDMAVVRTIKTLAAQGLSGEEIGIDMGVVVGWRVWSISPQGMCGAGTGQLARWPLDKPCIAVCVDTSCDTAKRARCAVSGRPYCRVHATKNRSQVEGNGVLGMVAMWGDIIECETGWLAARAYPLAFESEMFARAYGVATLQAPIAAIADTRGDIKRIA